MLLLLPLSSKTLCLLCFFLSLKSVSNKSYKRKMKEGNVKSDLKEKKKKESHTVATAVVYLG